MNTLSFTPNAEFFLFGRRYRIGSVEETERGTQVGIVGPEGISTTKSIDYLLHQYQMGNLQGNMLPVKSPPLVARPANTHPLAADLPRADLDEGLRKWRLLCQIKNEGGFIRGNNHFWLTTFPELSAKFHFDAMLNRTTICRWRKKVIKAPDVPPEITLAPMNRLKGGAGQTRMSDDVLGITDQCIEDVFLSNPNTSIRHCHHELVARINAENKHRYHDDKLSCPSYQQLRRHVLGLSAYEIHASKHGKATADEEFRSTRYVKRRLTRALQRVEVDHTPLDVFIVDSEGAILGRARLTIVMDVATRAILGFSIGHDGASVIAVFEALRHAVSPKTYLKERYPTIKNAWPMHGVFELLVMDNGPEFHAADFVSTLRELCLTVDLAYMPRRKGNFKGTVEAIQKYLNRDMSDLQPGATQSHHWQRNTERPPEHYAVHTLDSLTELIHIWICDIYHVRIHKGLKTSPMKAWQEKVSLMPVRLPPSPDMLVLACTKLDQRRIQPYGIEVCELRSFNSDELQSIRRQYQHKDTVVVDVRFNPKLLDKIWVKHPDSSSWFEVPNSDWQTRDKSQFQLQVMNRMVREAAKDENLVISLADAYRRMCAIGNDLRNEKTIAQRMRALRMLGILPRIEVGNAPQMTAPSAPTSKEPVSKARHRKQQQQTNKKAADSIAPNASPAQAPDDIDTPPSAPQALTSFRVISALISRKFL